ncbi:MAG: carbon-nitrogen hydrolase family protein [Burkholderiales bacterium]|nr:carbon-nitrogen hydrolase family protein [Burkholderiales bacterium]
MTRTVRVAAAQTWGYPGKEEEKQVPEALQRIQEAADAGAQIVLLPEGCPGPFYRSNRFDGITPVSAKAKEAGIYVISSSIDPLPDRPGDAYIAAYLFGPDGTMIKKVRRTVPKGPMVYARWGFNYIGADEPIPVIDLPFGRIAITICGEMLVPEVARTLTLRGAEILFDPVGDPPLAQQPGFRAFATVRAIENNTWLVTCQQLSHRGDQGLGGIYSPNGPAVQHQGLGVVTHEIDLDELAEFRNPDPTRPHAPFAKGDGVPGLLHWRRPAMWNVLTAEQTTRNS